MKALLTLSTFLLVSSFATAQVNKTPAEIKAQSDSLLGAWEVVKIENLETGKAQELVTENKKDMVIVSSSDIGYNVIFKAYKGNLLRTEVVGYDAQKIIGAFGIYKSGQIETISKDTFTIIVYYKTEESRVTFQRLAT
jgi:hypothetical protein